MSSRFPPSLALTGGIPLKSQDLTASIVFAAAYFVLLPIAIWRLAIPASRCLTLIRPAVFIALRIGTFIIRGIQANGNYQIGLFVAEQILLLCGFVLLCEPLVTLLGCHITRYVVPSPNRTSFGRILVLLRMALSVALLLGIYAGIKFGSVNANSSQDTINTVKNSRDANAIICLVITALVGLVCIIAHAREQLPMQGTIFIIVGSVLLTIVSVYKILLYKQKHPAGPLHLGTKIAFYSLVSLPELLTVILLLSVNLNTTFDIPEALRKEKARRERRGPGGRGWNVYVPPEEQPLGELRH